MSQVDLSGKLTKKMEGRTDSMDKLHSVRIRPTSDDLLLVKELTALEGTDQEQEGDKESKEQMLSQSDSSGKQIYMQACKMFNQTPVSYYIREGNRETFRMRHHSLAAGEVKALCISITSNTTIEVLDLDDNGLSDQGCSYISEVLIENYFITELILSNNGIGAAGAIVLFEVLKSNNSLVKLDLSGNKIGEKACYHVAEALMQNTKLEELNLSWNGLGEVAGSEMGRMLQSNTSLVHLDISFNSLRTQGMLDFLQGLKKNIGLLTLNVASNGIALQCCAELGKTLKQNKYLEELDISNNRIPLAGTLPIARAFKFNNNLKHLDLSRNPMMADGCLIILECLTKSDGWGLRYLAFGTILVTRQIRELQKTLETTRFLLVTHGGIIEDWHRTEAEELPKSTREALCFLTDEECKQISSKLQEFDTSKQQRATLIEVKQSLEQLRWSIKSHEIIRRLTPLVKNSYIDYTTLM